MLAALDDDALNALLDQLPALAGRPRRLEDLSGGLTNRNVNEEFLLLPASTQA